MSFSNGTQMKSSVINSDGTPAAAAAPNTTTTRVPGPGRPQSYSSLYNNSKDTSDRLLWEMRVANRTPNTTPVSTVLNSPDLTDLDTKMRYQHSTLMQHHQIKVGRSPVGSGGANDSSNNSSNPSSPIQAPPGDGFIGGPGQTVYNRWHMMQQQQQLHHHQQPFGLLSDGEMVVFDDIDGGVSGGSGGGGGCDWRGLANRDILGSSPVPSENEDDDDEEDFDDGERNYYDVDSTKIQRIIGGLTIAEYEGSPRRFGNIDRDSGDPPGNGGCGDGGGSSSSIGAGRSTGAARPGFPKRVISPSISDTRPGSTEGTRGATQTAELIDLNDDPDRTGGRIPLSSSSCISDRLSGDLNGLTGHGTGMDSITDYGRLYSSMPILEDGLSSGHASDTENNLPPLPMHQSAVIPPRSGISIVMDRQHESFLQSEPDDPTINLSGGTIVDSSEEQESGHPFISSIPMASTSELEQQPEEESCDEVQEAIKDIKEALQKTKILPTTEGNSALDADHPDGPGAVSPVWVPRSYDKSRESLDSDAPVKLLSADEEEADTDLETDRLLGQQRLDDHGFGDEKSWMDRPKIRSILAPSIPLVVGKNHTAIRAGVGTQLSMESPTSKTPAGGNLYGNGGSILLGVDDDVTGGEKEELKLAADKSPVEKSDTDKKSKRKTKEGLLDPVVLIEGVLFRARYLGSTQLVCEGQPTKSTRMMQAEEAVSRIKAPEGESQPSTEVELFVSTEKIMVLNTDLKEIMMDHALRTISYIADIGDLVVLMARRRFVPQDTESVDPAAPLTSGQQPAGQTTKDGTGKQQDDGSNDNSSPPPKKSLPRGNRTPKMICHVFESEEAQFIAQSIGQAFQVAYMDFLKANGIEDHSFMKEMDYQEVLNSQEIFGDELEIFAKKELQKEVVVPKAKGEILGVVIVESGWGSMLPTVVIANLASTGAAARCGQLNIGDQIIAINGLSLVGLPLSTCQGYIKNTKNQTAVKFTVVPCAPVVEVKIKRPNTKYQLGFSVQNGVICSLLRGGIAERGGVRVGHRIIEINNQSVVAVPHEKIVNLLATSVGEIHMKTMPTSMFRLLTGQENPVYI
ncbi:amyloid-beta A4 precursor protein-binding family A member 1-like isoform X5 [Uranotaenia lowii]|uniref:amyloid-beta A4 precursor protein-binding family A member 1-like isoform X5 n=1 Tax=Uranotaenia lowii TaxID=190385 RepID=UPI00247A7124|nr:amyloid-beta A4 precursor protein-binding family A member 1-like isoform X5 [Uranotaenia lowii]